MTDEHLTKVDINWLLHLLEGEEQDIKYIRPFIVALKELRAARECIEALRWYENAEYDSNSCTDYLLQFRAEDALKKYDEVCNAKD